LGKFGKDTYYHHFGLRVSQWFNIPPVGWLRYQVNGGIITNTLPYLLLHSPTANETYFYAPNAFNTLARYEFVSDTYIDALLVASSLIASPCSTSSNGGKCSPFALRTAPCVRTTDSQTNATTTSGHILDTKKRPSLVKEYITAVSTKGRCSRSAQG
jgi:hypothetical protein